MPSNLIEAEERLATVSTSDEVLVLVSSRGSETKVHLAVNTLFEKW